VSVIVELVSGLNKQSSDNWMDRMAAFCWYSVGMRYADYTVIVYERCCFL